MKSTNPTSATKDHEQRVCVVDDDSAVRDSLALMLGLKGFDCRVFESAEHFLSAAPKKACCLILDLRMGGMSGLELQRRIATLGVDHQVIFLSAYADTQVMRQAFLGDAADFLEKPVVASQLHAAIERAFARIAQNALQPETDRALDLLTAREREVLDAVVKGLSHREIGELLGISPRTVEVHKARIMGKLEARSLAELLRRAIRSDAPPKVGLA